MVQHVFIVDNGTGTPIVQNPEVNIWRDDQQVVWKINMPDVGWDNGIEGGPNRAVQFDGKLSPWTGSAPAPVGLFPTGLDRRTYSAMGPGPNDGIEPVMYSYQMYVVDKNGTKYIITDIDPEIGNQPQP